MHDKTFTGSQKQLFGFESSADGFFKSAVLLFWGFMYSFRK